MSKMVCICGEILRDQLAPNPIKTLMISDEGLERLFDEKKDDVSFSDMLLAMTQALECPNCKRLWVFFDGRNKAPTCYENKGKI